MMELKEKLVYAAIVALIAALVIWGPIVNLGDPLDDNSPSFGDYQNI